MQAHAELAMFRSHTKRPALPTSSTKSSYSAIARHTDDAMKDFIHTHQGTVPHVPQSYSWDCGLACVEMALRARGAKQSSFSDLRKSCVTDSIWSIDLAYLLRRYSLEATYFTIIKGVRPEYRKQEFYRKQLPQDTKRVNQLFQTANCDGVHVVQKTVSIEEIRDAVLEGNRLILVLLDKGLMRCSICDRSAAPTKTLSSLTNSLGFLGHYVLLYAYNPVTDSFLMKDPATDRQTCVISGENLDEARLAFGTDQDIIFISDLEGETASYASSMQVTRG